MRDIPSAPPNGRTTARGLLNEPTIAPLVRLVSGADALDRSIHHPRIHQSGLSLSRPLHRTVARRLQSPGQPSTH